MCGSVVSVGCATQPEATGAPTEAVLAALAVPLSCLVSAVAQVLDGTDREKATKCRALFGEALDRICAEVGS